MEPDVVMKAVGWRCQGVPNPRCATACNSAILLPMFLRRHRKRAGGETCDYWSLVKTVRTARGPRHQAVARLGKLDGAQVAAAHAWQDVDALRAGQAPLCQLEPGPAPPPPAPCWREVDAQRRLLGVVALQDLKEFLNSTQDLDSVIACDVMPPPPKCLTPGQRLLDALPLVLESELRNVPVVNNPNKNQIVGSVSRAELLAIFSEAIAEKSKPAG